MDYGHQNSQGSAAEGAFFTPGIGNAAPWVNASGPSLNSESVYGAGQAPEYSTQGLQGTNGMGIAEPLPQALQSAAAQELAPAARGDWSDGRSPRETGSETPSESSLGVIRDTDPTPYRPIPAADLSNLLSQVHPQGDHISDTTVQAVDRVKHDLGDADKSLSDAYEEAVAMRSAYLKELGYTEGSE